MRAGRVTAEAVAWARDLTNTPSNVKNPAWLAEQAEQLALRLAAELGVVGVLAVELFETTDGRLLVNELAMRPHNSAHWTIEGARTSQFEQHLRAVLDYPLGATTPTAVCIAAYAGVIHAASSGRPNDRNAKSSSSP